MKLQRSILAAISLTISACTTVGDNRHVSPSGKYSINFYEAISVGDADLDSYYQIVNSDRPDIQYSSIGGATPLNDKDIFWSPTEKTCIILENRPGAVGLQSGSGSIRILWIVRINESIEYHQIYMRPFERQYFKEEKINVLSASDVGVTFQAVNEQVTKEFSIENLIEESYQQDARNLKDDEIHD